MSAHASMEAGAAGRAALEIARLTREAALDRKGMDVVILDLRGLSSVADFFVLVSGHSPPHLKAVANQIERSLAQHGVPLYRRSGVPEDGWVVLDCVDVVTHILLKERREYYAIEELWEAAPRVP